MKIFLPTNTGMFAKHLLFIFSLLIVTPVTWIKKLLRVIANNPGASLFGRNTFKGSHTNQPENNYTYTDITLINHTPIKTNDPAIDAGSFSFSKNHSHPFIVFKPRSMQTKLRFLLMTVSVIIFSFVTSFTFGQATVTTDQPDYAPRSTATFTGSGFAPGEDVVLKVKNLFQPCHTVNPDS
ncbi:MAG: hypothetical protein ABJA71_01725, partial [Ginsengibacter sp.]